MESTEGPLGVPCNDSGGYATADRSKISMAESHCGYRGEKI